MQKPYMKSEAYVANHISYLSGADYLSKQRCRFELADYESIFSSILCR